MFGRRLTQQAFIEHTLEDVRRDIAAVSRIALGERSWRPLTEKERYYLLRREALIVLGFGLAFDRLRRGQTEFDGSPDAAAAVWGDHAYERVLSPQSFTSLAEVFHIHRKRAAWDELWTLVARNAHGSVQRCIDPVRRAPRLTFMSFEHDHFYGTLYDYSESGSEDPNSFWDRALVPKDLAFARYDVWPSAMKRLKPTLTTCYLKGLAP